MKMQHCNVVVSFVTVWTILLSAFSIAAEPRLVGLGPNPYEVAHLGSNYLRLTGQISSAVSFSPDGNYFAAYGPDNMVSVYYVNTGELARDIPLVTVNYKGDFATFADYKLFVGGGPSNPWPCIVWVPNQIEGKLTHDELSAIHAKVQHRKSYLNAQNGHVVIKSAESRETIADFAHLTPPCMPSISNDEAFLAVADWVKSDAATIRVYDVATQSEQFHIENGMNNNGSRKIAISGKHSLVFSSSDGSVRRWNYKTGTELKPLFPSYRWTEVLGVSPDDKFVVVQSGRDLLLYDLEKDVLTFRFEAGRPSTGVAFAPSRNMMASWNYGSSSVIRFWNLDTGKEVLPQTGHLASLYETGLHISSDGKRIASVDTQKVGLVWDVDRRIPIYRIPDVGSSDHWVSWKTNFSADGQWFGSQVMGSVRYWQVGENKPIQLAASKSPGNPIVVVAHSQEAFARSDGGGAIEIGPWVSRAAKDAWNGVQLRGHLGIVTAMDFSWDTSLLASAGDDHTLRLWNTKTGEEVANTPSPDRVAERLLFNPDAKRVAVFAAGRISILDWKTSKVRPLLELGDDVLTQWTFTPAGDQLIIGYQDGTLRAWDTATGTKVHEIKPHAKEVTVLAYSKSGSTLITAGKDGYIYGFDTKTWEKQNTLGDGKHAVDCLALAEITPRVMAADSDGFAAIYNWKTGEVLKQFPARGDGFRILTLYPDGKKIKFLTQRLIQNEIELSAVAQFSGGWDRQGDNASGCNFAFSRDGRAVISATEAGVSIADRATGDLLDRKEILTPQASAIAVSPDGKCFSIGGAGMSVWSIRPLKRIWNVAGDAITSDRRLQNEKNLVKELAFSPDGRQLAVCLDTVVQIWAVATHTQTQMLHAWDLDLRAAKRGGVLTDNLHGKSSMAWTSDGRMLLFLEGFRGEWLNGGKTDISIYEVATGSRMMWFRDFTKYELGSFVVSEDGRRLAMKQAGGTISVWDLKKVLDENVYNPADKANLSVMALWNELETGEPKVAFHVIGSLQAKGAEAVQWIEQYIQDAKSNGPLKARAINVLERIDSGESRKLLAALAKDPDNALASEAQNALGRLEAKGSGSK